MKAASVFIFCLLVLSAKVTCDCVCGANETYTCKYECPTEQCVIGNRLYTCPEDQECEPGCACAEGYRRLGANGSCVLEDECPKIGDNGCGENETYTTCKVLCPTENCVFGHILIVCPKNQTCTAGCQCNKGYRRLSGKCIPADQCPKLGGPK